MESHQREAVLRENVIAMLQK